MLSTCTSHENVLSANCPAFDAERDVPVKRSENTFQIMAISMMMRAKESH
jgi:hypothetical protein